ncbi:MAG: hypothetical protein KatS3mg131_3503 [Candidatus Tectimicrobiota bacterium]|nr:MAG: hypothetical protein KatS3mg131_3503 [Candidatus Tectomicrobia bacterium]
MREIPETAPDGTLRTPEEAAVEVPAAGLLGD